MWYESEASLLRAFNQWIPPLLTFNYAAQLGIRVFGLLIAVELHPRWRRHASRLRLLCGPPFALWALTFGLIIAANDYVKITEPTLLPRVARRFLQDFALLLPGAAAAIALRRRDPELFPAFRPIADTVAGRAQIALQIRHGFIGGLLLAVWSFWGYFHLNTTQHPDLNRLQRVIAEYPTIVAGYVWVSVLLSAVIHEELAWRLIGQAFVMRLASGVLRRQEAMLLAVMLTSVGWTFSHSASYVFIWAKFAQIMPLGLILGVMMERYGLWACLLAHFLHNALPFFYVAIGGDFPGIGA